MTEAKTTAKKTPAKKPAAKKAVSVVEAKSESIVLMSDSKGNRMNVVSSKVEEFKSKGFAVV